MFFGNGTNMAKFYLAFNPFVVIFQFTKWNRINVIAFFEPVWNGFGSMRTAIVRAATMCRCIYGEGEPCEFDDENNGVWVESSGNTAAGKLTINSSNCRVDCYQNKQL